MKKLVQLDSAELVYFFQLQQQLMEDSISIRVQYEKYASLSNHTNWISTNSYYLNQIDSSKYTAIISKLKNKLVDDFLINKDGSVIFTIKQRIKTNFGDYNETYTHQLISAGCNCPIETVFNHVDSVFVDSTINNNWRYTFYKVLTGH